MKNLFLPTDNTANKISYYLILLLLFSLPFDRFYSHLILITLTLHTFIGMNKKSLKSFFTWNNMLLQSVFFITVASTFYSMDKNQAYIEIGRQIPILLVPIVFFVNPIDLRRYINSFLLLFAMFSIIAVLYLYIDALVVIRFYKLPLFALFSTAFTNHNFSAPFGIHATYFSLQLSIALVYLLSIFARESMLFKYKIWLVFCCFILSAAIIQLSSRSIFIALVIIINFAIPYFLFSGKKRFQLVFILVPITAITILGLYQIDGLKNRYFIELHKDLEAKAQNDLTDPRLSRWKLGMELVAQSPIIGHGSGTETALLKELYFEHKLYRSFLSSLNAHNEYLSLLIKSGIWGLILYMITLFFGFKACLLRKDFMLFSFLTLIVIVSFSENILDVDKGIFFYSLFFALLYFSTSPKTADLQFTK